ncbi:MAG: type II toxin-antitoxin system RelE/ParE family toxin [Verrucomicrobia bacterium]|nr:type II toxin-antitoxin system RelE/ParE family toxin [Verrucomicrobiota bacterium]
MKLQILDCARDDLIEGYHFYEAMQVSLGDDFLASLHSDIECLRTSGGIHPQTHRQLHRALSKRFPFAVFYTVDEDVVRVRAVVDCRRNPSWIRQHLKGS